MRISDWSSDVCSSDLDLVADRMILGRFRRNGLARGRSLGRGGLCGRLGTGSGNFLRRGSSGFGHRLCPLLLLSGAALANVPFGPALIRSEEHTSELQSLMRISYAVFCLKKKNTITNTF